MTDQYLPVLLAVLGASGFMGVMLGINYLLGPKPKAVESPAVKLEPFECGIEPMQSDNRRRTAVKFYLVAILFIIFGLGETSKVMLITIGTAPVMIRCVSQAVMEIPRELIIKAETLGASTWQMITRVVLPQVMPKLITAIRLGLVPAWIFLISAEAIASTSGLGYRIFLVRRYLAMDVILPYVAWITLLAFILDRLLLMASRRTFPWNHLSGDSL